MTCEHRHVIFHGRGNPVGEEGERYSCHECGAEGTVDQTKNVIWAPTPDSLAPDKKAWDERNKAELKLAQEKVLAERKELREQYGELYDKVTQLLNQRDMMGLSFEEHVENYEAEVGTILPRLMFCKGMEDVQIVVYEEFCRWFGVGGLEPNAGRIDDYKEVAQEIWAATTDYWAFKDLHTCK